MKKEFRYNEVSDKVCTDKNCTKRIKKNVLKNNPEADKCYPHWVKSKGLESRREFYK
jgi:hypothetical protein